MRPDTKDAPYWINITLNVLVAFEDGASMDEIAKRFELRIEAVESLIRAAMLRRPTP